MPTHRHYHRRGGHSYIKVLIIGSSHICRLEKYLHNQHITNFSLNPNLVRVHMKGISGGAIEHNNKKKRFASLIQQVLDYLPQILFIQIGSNDLARQDCNIDQLISMIFYFCNFALQRGVRTCLIGTHWDRLPVEFYTEHKANFNSQLMQRCKNEKNIFFCYHPTFKCPPGGMQSYLKDDGVHLNDRGNSNLFRSIKESIKNTCKKYQEI